LTAKWETQKDKMYFQCAPSFQSCFAGEFLKILRKHTPECDFEYSASCFALKSLYLSLSQVAFEYK